MIKDIIIILLLIGVIVFSYLTHIHCNKPGGISPAANWFALIYIALVFLDAIMLANKSLPHIISDYNLLEQWGQKFLTYAFYGFLIHLATFFYTELTSYLEAKKPLPKYSNSLI